ncbi:MAG: cytochrome c5 family protein [Candidatus Marinimicrobia bacterium]|nr:cytochrome c5 family protein [Candidatus Neomarinimicrobiota bacterium]
MIAVASQPAMAAVETIYGASCEGCHMRGVGDAIGAPGVGNKAAWKPRIAKGIEALYSTAINGSTTNPIMMPRGGSALSDETLKEIVDYMVEQSQ